MNKTTTLVLLFLSLIMIVYFTSDAIKQVQAISDVIVTVSDISLFQNTFQVGSHFDFSSMWNWIKKSNNSDYIRLASIKMIRMQTYHMDGNIYPCTNWDENTQTGTWNWTEVDNITATIRRNGAEPMYCLGSLSLGNKGMPKGMANDTEDIGFMRKESYVNFCVEWVRHFGSSVRYYELINEPIGYISPNWNTLDATKLAKYFEWYVTAYNAMKTVNPSIKISMDDSTHEGFMDYWLLNGGTFDFLDFHKYDGWLSPYETPIGTQGCPTDAQYFTKAETTDYVNGTSQYRAVSYMRDKWFKQKGVMLETFSTETNLNSAWKYGTDPRIQQMCGVVWLALNFRMATLNKMNCLLYFDFASSFNNKPSGGSGFGMLNSADSKPWFPYYVVQIYGNDLNVGDSIIDSNASSDFIRTLAWKHGTKLNLLLICKSPTPITVFTGLVPNATVQVSYMKIEDITGTDYNTSRQLKVGILDSSGVVTFNGYTVMLLQVTYTGLPFLIEYSQAIVVTILLLALMIILVKRRSIR